MLVRGGYMLVLILMLLHLHLTFSVMPRILVTEEHDENTGTISSLGVSPDANTEYTYYITVKENKYIKLSVTLFDMIGGTDCQVGTPDLFHISTYDGETKGDLLSTICGNLDGIDNVWVAHKGFIVVVETTDDGRTVGDKQGFAASWIALDEDPCTPWTNDGALGGTITSPFYPDPYFNLANCQYEIVVAPPHMVTYLYTVLDVQVDGGSCAQETINEYGGAVGDGLSFKRCVADGRRKTFGTNHVGFEFISDEDTVKSGWAMDFFTLCQTESIESLDGERTSLGYPFRILINMYCSIRFPDDILLEVFFVDMDWPGVDGDCGDNKLTLYWGNPRAPMFVLCDWWDEGEVGIYLEVSFSIEIRTNDEDTLDDWRGFKVKWQSKESDVCTETAVYTGTSGYIKTPNYPIMYYNNKHCEYVIDVGNNTNIALQFVKFDIEPNLELPVPGECFDTVAIYDGDIRVSLDGLIGIFCNSESGPPGPYISSGGVMSLILETDMTVGHSGFKAHWFIPPEVKDFLPSAELKVSGNWLRVWFGLVGMDNKFFKTLIETGYNWTFVAYAKHQEICDVEYEDVYGVFEPKTSCIMFDFGLRPGRYFIRFRAMSSLGRYDFENGYSIYIAPNPDLEKVACDMRLKKYAVDFMVKEKYKNFRQKDLKALKTSLTASIQQIYDDVYLASLEFSEDHKTGYLHVRAYMRGARLMTKLRYLCAFIADPWPFTYCVNGQVKKVKHDRKVKVLGREFGHGTDNPCWDSMFVMSAACSCPCNCAGRLDVKLP